MTVFMISMRLEWILKSPGEAEKILLKVFKMVQDKYVRLTWEDAVVFPQEAGSE